MTNAGFRVDEYSGFQTEWSEQAITVFKYFLKTSNKSMFLVQKKLKKKTSSKWNKEICNMQWQIIFNDLKFVCLFNLNKG